MRTIRTVEKVYISDWTMQIAYVITVISESIVVASEFDVVQKRNTMITWMRLFDLSSKVN